MKRLMSIIIIGIVLAGCLEEDYSFCPPEQNVTLHFRLPDPVTGEELTFLDYISTVTTAIYDDATGTLVQTIISENNNLQEFEGIKLSLNPGTYRVICWGNSGNNTKINELERAYSNYAYLDYRTVQNGVTGNGDPLYYAPNKGTRTGNEAGEYIMTIEPMKGYEDTLNFRHAYRRIEIYVKGFSSGSSTTPVIRLTGLPAELGFLNMQPSDSSLITSELSSQMVTVGTEGDTFALSPFNVFYLQALQYDINVEILDPVTREVIYTTKLNDHINPYTDDPEKVLELQLLIEFIGANVSVSVPKWDSEDVDYSWWD